MNVETVIYLGVVSVTGIGDIGSLERFEVDLERKPYFMNRSQTLGS